MNADIVIAGGGIIGLFSAYQLALQGVKPVLIERGDFGKQSSWAAGGILTPLLPWDYANEVRFLTRHAAANYADLAPSLLHDTGHDIEYWACGLTVHSADKASIQAWCEQHQEPYQLHNHCQSKVVLTTAAQIRTPILIDALVTRLSQMGVTLLDHTSVKQCCIEKNQVTGVTTSGGHIASPTVVWATGAWAPSLESNDTALESPPIFPVKGQMIAMQNCPSPPNTILYKDGHYLIPRKDGLVIAGSTVEEVGYDCTVTDEARDQLWEKSIALLPALEHSQISHHWAGLRPGNKDNIPVIGPHPTIKGLYYNCGHYRYGIAMAPASSRILSRWVLNNGSGLSALEQSYSRFD